MNAEAVLDRFETKRTKGIYAYMYGTPFIHTSDKNGKDVQKRDKVIFIEKEKLQVTPVGIIFVWGMPGPDYNYYYYKDYAITWAFHEDELRKVDSYKRPEITYKDIKGRDPKEVTPEEVHKALENGDNCNDLVGDYVMVGDRKFTIVSTNPDGGTIDDPPKHHVVIVPNENVTQIPMANPNTEETGCWKYIK